ncbi:hypothetical protein O7627_14275 [Solwaraspora sp. WMMD1047]|uniref:hypothetical protein n=1 Tax=Solwaraspora sp. WMMD1047 TaxID=3016102 RepID=UPI002417B35F|nr:hypothetical protein [Solwaraspora sp. WMMD1047]MDG4830465.1 hypothetical protein [Solwaraspora sp. WMMD1047]
MVWLADVDDRVGTTCSSQEIGISTATAPPGGMVVGVPRDIAGLHSPEAPTTPPEIVLDVLGDRDIPVLGNVDFGHAGPNLPMPIGIRVGLDTRQRTLSLLEPTVRPHVTPKPPG